MKQRVIRKRDHDDDVDEGKEVVTAKPTIKNSKITTKPKLTVGLSFDDDNDLNQGGGFQIKKSKLSQAVIINHFDSSELVKEESLGGMYSKESLDLLKKSQLFTTINNNESNDNEVANHDENEYKNQMNIDLVDQVDQFDSSPMNSHSINQNTHNQNTQEYEIVLSGEDAEKLEEIEEMEQRDKGITINTNSAMNQDFIPFRTNKYLSDTNMDDMNQTERDIEMDQEMKNAKLRMKADITKSSLKSDRIFMSTSGGEKGKSKGSVRFATTDDNNSHSSMLEVDVQWENQITQRAGLGLTSTHRPLLRSDYDNEGSTIANITSTTTATATTSYMKHSSTVGSHSKGFDFHQIKSTLSQALSSFTESTNALSQKSSRLEQERELLYKQKIVLQRKVEVGEPVFRYMQDLKESMAEIVGMLREKTPLIDKLNDAFLSLISSFNTLLLEKRIHAQEDMLYTLSTTTATTTTTETNTIQSVLGLSIGDYTPTGILVALQTQDKNEYTDAFGRSIEPPYETEYKRRIVARKFLLDAIKSSTLLSSEGIGDSDTSGINNSDQVIPQQIETDKYYDQPYRAGLGLGLGLGFSTLKVPSSSITKSEVDTKSNHRVNAMVDELYYDSSILLTISEQSEFNTKIQSLLQAHKLIFEDVKHELQSISYILNKLRILRNLLPGRYITSSITHILPSLIHTYVLLEMIQKSLVIATNMTGGSSTSSSSSSSSANTNSTNSSTSGGIYNEFIVSKLVDVRRYTWFDELIDYCSDTTWLGLGLGLGTGKDILSSSSTSSLPVPVPVSVSVSVSNKSDSKRVTEFDISFVKVKNEELQLQQIIINQSVIKWYQNIITSGGYNPFSKLQTCSLFDLLVSLCDCINMSSEPSNDNIKTTTTDGNVNIRSSDQFKYRGIVEGNTALSGLLIDIMNIFQSARISICLPSFQPSANSNEMLFSILYRQLAYIRTLFINFKSIKMFIGTKEYLLFMFELMTKSNLRYCLLSYLNHCVSTESEQLFWIYSFILALANESILNNDMIESTTAATSTTTTSTATATATATTTTSKIYSQYGYSQSKIVSIQKLFDKANTNIVVIHYSQFTQESDPPFLSELYKSNKNDKVAESNVLLLSHIDEVNRFKSLLISIVELLF